MRHRSQREPARRWPHVILPHSASLPPPSPAPSPRPSPLASPPPRLESRTLCARAASSRCRRQGASTWRFLLDDRTDCNLPTREGGDTLTRARTHAAKLPFCQASIPFFCQPYESLHVYRRIGFRGSFFLVASFRGPSLCVSFETLPSSPWMVFARQRTQLVEQV